MLEKNGNLQQSLESYKKAITIREAATKADPANAVARGDLSGNYAKAGDVSLKLGDTAGALESYRKALTIREQLSAASPEDVEGHIQLARIYESLGAYSFMLAEKNKRAEDWQEARRRYQQSEDVWVDLRGKGKLTADYARKPDEISHKLAACNTALSPRIESKK
jgi:tetratricopeptide (TPR) repeat protein